MPQPSPLPVASYATGGRRDAQLFVGDYLFHATAWVLVTCITLAPLVYVDRVRSAYAKLGLALPSSTGFLFDAYDTLDAVGVRYWVWLLPTLLPLWTARGDLDRRRRVMWVAVLLSGLAGVFVPAIVSLPLWTMSSTLASSGGG